MAKLVESHELKHILDAFCLLEMYSDDAIKVFYNTQDMLYFVLKVAAQHGNLSIIRFLWPSMEATTNNMNG